MIGVVIRSIDERGDQVMISIRCFSRIPLKDRDQESVEQRCFLRRRVDIMIMVPVSLFADFGNFRRSTPSHTDMLARPKASKMVQPTDIQKATFG